MSMITCEKLMGAENAAKVVIPSMDPFDYTSTQQGLAIGIVIGFTALAFVILCIRVAGRVSSHQFALDDALVCIAMVLSILETAASYMYIRTNFIGIRWQDIPPHDPVPGLVWNYAIEILYNPILALVKTSILLFLQRLFGHRPGVRRFIVWLNIANIGMMIGVFFGVILQCIPISKTWEPTLEGTCIDRRVLFTVMSSFNIFTDILMLALPMRIFISLKIPKRTKIALMFVFLLGFLTTITSMIRLALLVQGLFMLKTSLNPDANIGFVISAIETNLALITASAPALRPLLRTWFPKMFRVERDGITGNTERRVLGTIATRMTRLKSQTQLQSPTQRQSEEAAMPFNGIIKKTDIVVLRDKGVDNSRPSTAPQGLGSQQQTEKWI
ncbi:hypothetical protein F5B22DRAFT_640866 [Xylaria bambusicola]|uniref:uncharacterized protein n=1 Tax=Xylaria bambusicola TaxID=326684 RepID=UPI0020074D8D|nr:uncharacterized protein F5B22DRAFT_640866 [Xylaria bambusicola]KAI0527889.1 hypothetical protein F5B22DRAFT_640866 [Xylaria bambusicola]